MIPATILVTGSSSGLGYQMVETLARRSHTVFASMRASSGKNFVSQCDRVGLEPQTGRWE